MEQLSTLLEEKKCHDICHDFHVLTSCHEEQRIDINDYRYLVEQLSKWRVFYPKAQIKKYGAKNCWIAMQRTKSMCPRVPGAYFTTTVRDIVAGDKKQPVTNSYQSVSNAHQLNDNQIVEVNKKVEQNLPSQSPTSGVKSKKGIFTPPNIINWQQAREFLCKLTDDDLADEQIFEFTNKIKRKYNFA